MTTKTKSSGRPTDVSDAVHIGPYAALSRIAGLRHTVPLRDSVHLGPCHHDARKHYDARRRYWLSWDQQVPAASKSQARRNRRTLEKSFENDVYSGHQLKDELQKSPPEFPVVLWSARTWKDRLLLWWALDSLRQCNVAAERIWLADSSTPECRRTLADRECIAAHSTDLLQTAFSQLQPVGRRRLRSGAALWRKFAAKSPRAFDRARRTESHLFPELRKIGDAHRSMFPRLVRGRLRPSELDQLLLDQLDDTEWVRPVDVVIRSFRRKGFSTSWEEGFLRLRIQQWETHRTQNPVLASAPRDGVNSLTNIAHRLTDRGRRIQQRGYECLEDAPSLQVGGCLIHSRKSPWVRTGQNSDWRVERLSV